MLIGGSVMFFMAREMPLFMAGVSVMGLGVFAMIWAIAGLSRKFNESRSRLEANLLSEIEGFQEQKDPPKRFE